MNELTVKVPDYLRKQAEALASKEHISVDEVVSLALASHPQQKYGLRHWPQSGTRRHKAKEVAR